MPLCSHSKCLFLNYNTHHILPSHVFLTHVTDPSWRSDWVSVPSHKVLSQVLIHRHSQYILVQWKNINEQTKKITTKVWSLARGNLDAQCSPQLAVRISFSSSRSLQGASTMGTWSFKENLSFRGGPDSSLWVHPGIQGRTERSCHEHLQNDLWEDEVDPAPAQVHKWEWERSASRYGGTSVRSLICFFHQAVWGGIPDPPAM